MLLIWSLPWFQIQQMNELYTKEGRKPDNDSIVALCSKTNVFHGGLEDAKRVKDWIRRRPKDYNPGKVSP